MPMFESLFIILAFVVVLGALVFTMDDLFIDAYALFKRIKPALINADLMAKIKSAPQKNIAIIVANWKEAEVIAPMIRGNLRGLSYQNYTFFLGVYPNDTATWEAASKLEALYPHKVVVVVNTQPGPTSKGQMLNEMARQIFKSEQHLSKKYDLLLMQDSEDVLHPHSLSLMNYYSSFADFVQIPVFSFDVAPRSLVGGIYIDEFAESHTKDLLVREALGAAVPSAGVGTLLSRELVLSLQDLQKGDFLKEDTLTEDYHLGMMTKELGFKSKFACVRYEKDNGQKEFIATREYFPSALNASMRQKSRWTLGIAFQGLENLSWRGSFIDKYFMWRDRRGPWNSILIILSTLLLAMFVIADLTGDVPAVLRHPAFQLLLGLNLLNMTVRLVQRMIAVSRTNARVHIALVPVRWLLANVVNIGATYKAYRQYQESQKTGKRPVWIKTDHRLPEHFGKEIEVQNT
ncbi:glycosyltransferase [Bdellovibrio bacteriovorus]|uniref:glycosyltransferase n=1 Tax=Bdellovibrio bacteriovorus TaxID=959 RepID=UPI0035A6AFB0